MKILVLGGSGRTGQHVVRQALATGHTVEMLVRRSALLAPTPGLHETIGDPTELTDVSRAAADADAVISVLGHGRKSDVMVLAGSARAVVSALANRPGIPFLVVSQGLLFPSTNPITSLLRWILMSTVKDSKSMEEALVGSPVDYTIVRPPRLKDGPTQQGYQVEVGKRPSGPASMNRVDLARFLVDEVQQRRYSRSVIGITRSS